MHLSRALSALLVASAFAACSVSAAAPSHLTPAPTRTPVPESTVAPRLTDKQIARRGLLRQADFPKNWKVNTSTGEQVKCRTTTAARKAAAAAERSKTFTSGPNTEAESAAYVYASNAAATRHFKPLSGSATTSCLVREIKRAFTYADSFEVGTVTKAPLQLDETGDDRAGTRITFPVSGKGVDADVLLDVVVVRVGRTLALELFVDAYTPFDEQFREKLTAAQVRRLNDALSN